MARALPDHWFYAAASGATADGYGFDAGEVQHATRVLRLSVGDEIQWLDGRGVRYRGTITALSKSGMEAVATSAEQTPPPVPLRLHVGQLHDASRLEWLCEKATELGVTAITLLSTGRVQRPRYRLPRLRAKVVSAMKQSGRSYLPNLGESTLSDVLGALPPGGCRLLAHCYRDLARTPFTEAIGEAAAVDLFIGPEGDFTREEVVFAQAAHVTTVSLGTARLRTETAAVAALSVLALR